MSTILMGSEANGYIQGLYGIVQLAIGVRYVIFHVLDGSLSAVLMMLSGFTIMILMHADSESRRHC